MVRATEELLPSDRGPKNPRRISQRMQCMSTTAKTLINVNSSVDLRNALEVLVMNRLNCAQEVEQQRLGR